MIASIEDKADNATDVVDACGPGEIATTKGQMGHKAEEVVVQRRCNQLENSATNRRAQWQCFTAGTVTTTLKASTMIDDIKA